MLQTSAGGGLRQTLGLHGTEAGMSPFSSSKLLNLGLCKAFLSSLINPSPNKRVFCCRVRVSGGCSISVLVVAEGLGQPQDLRLLWFGLVFCGTWRVNHWVDSLGRQR